MDKLLIINGGSSSLKFQLIEKKTKNIIAKGLAERIFIDGKFTIKISNKKNISNEFLPNHKEAIVILFKKLKEYKCINDIKEIKGVGHRIVQGGEYFKESVLIKEKELKLIKKLGEIAPLHNIPEAIIIDAIIELMPWVSNVAVFDTSFHSTINKEEFLYAVPKEWYTKYKVRKYGAHGTSHKYITQIFSKKINKKEINIISCHLGNGASIAAIKNGKVINTSMGLTPLAGLIMGTRSGDIDPSIHEYIAKKSNISIDKITNVLNKESGVFAISGVSSDFRDIRNAANSGNENAKLAINMFVKRIATYIVDYVNQIGKKIDAIIFTAGIGENSPDIRRLIIKHLPLLELELSNNNNNNEYNDILKISTSNSHIPIYTIRTNEESIILDDLIKKM